MTRSSQPGAGRTSLKLLHAAREGDDAALEELCRYYLPRLRKWCRGRLPRRARDLVNTEDLIQETLVRTIRHVDHFNYRHSGAFQAYLRRALKNRIIDEIRRVENRPAHDTVKEIDPDGEPTPLEELVGREALDRYEKAFSQLKQEDQEAITARMEIGGSYREVAEALNKPSEDAARMAVKRALTRLAETMHHLK